MVSWKLAAEMKLELCTAALVMPKSCVLAVAILGLAAFANSPPMASSWVLACSNSVVGTRAPTSKLLSPFSVIFTHLANSRLTARN